MTQDPRNEHVQFAQCDHCWNVDQPDREPTRAVEQMERENGCAWCGAPTRSGILRRVRRHVVNYPEYELDAGGMRAPSQERRDQHAAGLAARAARQVAGPPRSDAEWSFLVGQAEQYGRALVLIQEKLGQVCENFEICGHPSCQSSYAAWSLADAALKGEELPGV